MDVSTHMLCLTCGAQRAALVLALHFVALLALNLDRQARLQAPLPMRTPRTRLLLTGGMDVRLERSRFEAHLCCLLACAFI